MKLALALVCCSALGLQVHTAPASASRGASPFVSAAVQQTDRLYELRWNAPRARSVTIYAIADQPRSDPSHPVAHGGGSGIALVHDLPPRTRWYFEFVTDDKRSLILADRSLHLASASNFRDVGGYRTQDGHWVRMGLAYRSNGLGALTAADHDRLMNLQLRLICDLRLAEERERSPDPEFPAVQAISADVSADSAHRAQGLRVALRSSDPGALTNFMKGAYRDFVDVASAQAAYHRLFERLADPSDLPTVFHCTAGKDRSGWAQAILLSLLGVPRKTILDDYVLTDRFMSESAREQIRKTLPELSDAASDAIVRSDPAYLEAAFREVDERYGSMDRYAHLGLHLEPATITAIRANFLTD